MSASKALIRVIIRRPHAYWFKQRYPDAPIPGLVFMSPDGKVTGTFSPLTPGQNLEVLRSAIKAQAEKMAGEKPGKPGEKSGQPTFHVREVQR